MWNGPREVVSMASSRGWGTTFWGPKAQRGALPGPTDTTMGRSLAGSVVRRMLPSKPFADIADKPFDIWLGTQQPV